MIIETLIGVGTFAGGMATYALWNSSGYKKSRLFEDVVEHKTNRVYGDPVWGEIALAKSKEEWKKQYNNSRNHLKVPVVELSQKEKYTIEEMKEVTNTPEQLQEAEEKWKRKRNRQTKTYGDQFIDVFTLPSRCNGKYDELPIVISDDGDISNPYYYVFAYIKGIWKDIYWKREKPQRGDVGKLVEKYAEKLAEQRIEKEEKERKAKEEQKMWEYIKNPQKEKKSSSPYDSEGYFDIDYKYEEEETEQESPTVEQLIEIADSKETNGRAYMIEEAKVKWNNNELSSSSLQIYYPYVMTFEEVGKVDRATMSKVKKMCDHESKPAKETLQKAIEQVLLNAGYTLQGGHEHDASTNDTNQRRKHLLNCYLMKVRVPADRLDEDTLKELRGITDKRSELATYLSTEQVEERMVYMFEWSLIRRGYWLPKFESIGGTVNEKEEL